MWCVALVLTVSRARRRTVMKPLRRRKTMTQAWKWLQLRPTTSHIISSKWIFQTLKLIFSSKIYRDKLIEVPPPLLITWNMISFYLTQTKTVCHFRSMRTQNTGHISLCVCVCVWLSSIVVFSSVRIAAVWTSDCRVFTFDTICFVTVGEARKVNRNKRK